MWRPALAVMAVMAASSAGANELYPSAPPPAAQVPYGIDNSNAPAPTRLPSPGDTLPLSARGIDTATPVQMYGGYPVGYAGANPMPPRSDATVFIPIDRPVQSTWYTRVDYFHWNERLYNADWVNEDGALVTLGYVRRNGCERYRAELFGGSMHSDQIWYDDSGQSYTDTRNYLGFRGEYDFLIEPAWWRNGRFLLGVGTRFWVRDLPVVVAASGDPLSSGYQETWWTIYPYAGMETKWLLRDWLELYSSMRVGLTAITLQHITGSDAYFYPASDVVQYPKCGPLGQVELGLRTSRVSLSAYFEAMTWGQSASVQDNFGNVSLQPASAMFTIGLQAGLNF